MQRGLFMHSHRHGLAASIVTIGPKISEPFGAAHHAEIVLRYWKIFVEI